MCDDFCKQNNLKILDCRNREVQEETQTAGSRPQEETAVKG